jgi:hypothetical protein
MDFRNRQAFLFDRKQVNQIEASLDGWNQILLFRNLLYLLGFTDGHELPHDN